MLSRIAIQIEFSQAIRTISVVFLSVVGISCFSQNYEAINPGRIYLYEDVQASTGGKYHLHAISIDTTEFLGNDVIHYNFNEIGFYGPPPYGNGCYFPEGTSWIGSRIIEKSGGDTWFFNKNYQDSTWKYRVINLKTQAKVNQPWIFYNSGTSTIYAEVISHDTMNFIGVVDSVKEIRLSLFQDYYGTILLSKNNGLLKTIIFRDFDPDNEDNPEMVNLIGITNPDLGYLPLTYGDIFDFDIGDEFHRNIRYNSMANTIDFYETRKVFYKSFNVDTTQVTYKMERYHWGWPGPGSYIFEHDTISKTYQNLNQVVNASMPDQTIFVGSVDLMVYHEWYSEQNLYNSRKIVYGPKFFFTIADTCYEMWLGVKNEKSLGIRITYIVGCGDYWNFPGDLWLPCSPCHNLKYFKKGTEEWGTPYIVPVGMSEFGSKPNTVYLFPNPANDILNLESAEPIGSIQFEIYNQLGQKCNCDIISRNDQIVTIDISTLKTGIYFIIFFGQGRMRNIKFLVK